MRLFLCLIFFYKKVASQFFISFICTNGLKEIKKYPLPSLTFWDFLLY